MHTINAKNKSVLIVGDTHLPYMHFDYPRFLKAVKNKYKCTLYCHIGDEADYHANSMHPSDSELYSAGHELEKVIIELEEWHKEFPGMKLCTSNHGSLMVRNFKLHGLPLKHLKELHEVYNTPTWSWHDDIILETKRGKIYLCHGKSGAYNKMVKEHGISCVQGHYHGKHEITWHKTIIGEAFNAFTGCGVDWESLAFAYGKNHIPKPLLGCLVINKKGLPRLEKMDLDKNGKWTGKI